MVHMSYAQWACLPSTYRNKVNPGSKAAQQGVREGDLISSINGKSTRDLTNTDAHALLRNAGDQLKLGLNQESSGSPKGKVYKSSLQTDTSIETVHKTTTKTVLNTRIVSSSEINKNGIDDSSRYSSLNGGPKSTEDHIDGDKSVWSPGSERNKQPSPEHREDNDKDGGIAPIWTPTSAGPSPRAERKEFRPVPFESPVLGRKKKPEPVLSSEAPPPPWEQEDNRKEPIQSTTSRIVNSHSAPTQGLNTLAGAPRLPRAQNPTITLLQKAREGQIPKGAAYLDQTEGYARPMLDDPLISPSEVANRYNNYGNSTRSGYLSEPETRVYDKSATLDSRRRLRNKENDYPISTIPRNRSGSLKHSPEPYRITPGRIEDYQPGQSTISDKEAKEWWDEVMDIFDGWLDENGRGSSEGQRFDKMPRALSLSYRPESNRHNVRVPNLNLCLKSCNSETRMRDKKLENGGRRRLAEVVDSQSVLGRSKNALLSNKSRFVDSLKLDLRTNDDMQSSRIIRPLGHGDFWQAAGMLEGKSKSFVLPDRNMNRSTPQIGTRSSRSTRLEDLSSFLPTMPSSRNHRHHRIPPSSSTSSSSSSSTTHITLPTPTSNAKTSPSRQYEHTRNSHTPKSYMSQALKESGYESDSTLIFRRREDVNPLSPLEQRLAYKTIQRGGDVPLHGLRKAAPERPKESPRRYVEGDITIHYRSPVRTEAKELLSEEELTRRSAENMRRVYQEERRRKYLQELHDIDSRRHTDNFIPSQKSPISLNRYDDFIDDLSSYRSRSQDPTPEPRLVARALYNFVGQSTRELTFRRGDLIFVRRQVDKNWYEGEHNAMVGLFPFNYVEIIPFDGMRTTPKKPYEGQARAKFNFIAQTHLELSLAKGELVVLTRRVDENWYEGRIGNRKGIFPTSYVEVLAEPGNRPETPVQSKPVASPAAHSLLSNGSSGGKLSMGPHHYTPIIPNSNMSQPHYNSLPRCAGNKMQVAPAVNETLHIDTHSEPIPYRALYNYRPQNEDELELKENDTVYVMEKCDDGWYVGSSQRTGYFGTFPGNYVERL